MPEQFVAYLEQTAQGNLGISYIDPPAGRSSEIRDKIWPTVFLVGTRHAPLGGRSGVLRRDPVGLEAEQRVRPRLDRGVDVHLRDARLLPRDPAARVSSRSGWRGCRPVAWRRPRVAVCSTGQAPDPAVRDARDRLLRRVRDHHALVAARGARRGLPRSPRARRVCATRWSAATHAVPNAIAAGRHAARAQPRLRALRRDRGGDGVLVARARPGDRGRAQGSRLPDAAGPLPDVQRGDHLREPRHGPGRTGTSTRG